LHCLALKLLSRVFLQVHLLSCADPDQPLRLVQPRTAGLEYFVAHSQGQLYILTNANGAANYQLMTAPLHTPCSAHWKPLVPERPGTAVEDLEVYASHAVLYERQQGRPAVSVLNLLAQASKAADSEQQAAGVFQDSPAALTSKQQQTAHVVVEVCNALPTSQRQQHELEQEKRQQQQPGAIVAEHPQPAQPQLATLSFPSWALSIQPGANPDYHTRTVRLHVASPVHPQHVYDYHLDTAAAAGGRTSAQT
jgi:protease II